MIEINEDSFLAQTAKDYDLGYETVKRIFHNTTFAVEFYQALEEEIKNAKINTSPEKNADEWEVKRAILKKAGYNIESEEDLEEFMKCHCTYEDEVKIKKALCKNG